MSDLDIAEVSRRAGVSASTLRFYDELGLIQSTGRAGLRRLFDPGVLDQLALIALAQAAGFSLTEIRGMFGPAGQLQIDRAMMAAKAEELGRVIRRLQAMRNALQHVAECPSRDHLECPSFQRMLRLASTGRIKSDSHRTLVRPADKKEAAAMREASAPLNKSREKPSKEIARRE